MGIDQYYPIPKINITLNVWSYFMDSKIEVHALSGYYSD